MTKAMSVPTTAWGHAQQFRTRKRVGTVMMVCLTLLMALLTLSATHSAHANAAVVSLPFGLMTLISGRITLQMIRGRVSVSASGLSVRGAFGSRHYAASEIDHVEVEPAGNGRVAVLWLRSGRRVRVAPLTAGGTRAAMIRLNAQVDEINRVLQTGAHRSADDPLPSLRIAATRARAQRRAAWALILVSVMYTGLAIAAAVIIRTPSMIGLMCAAILLQVGFLWRLRGGTRRGGRTVWLMLTVLTAIGSVAPIALRARSRSVPLLTAPAGFTAGVAQAPHDGLWELSGTITSSAGYSDSAPGTQINELIGIQRRCATTCHYRLTRIFENPVNGNLTATVTLSHQADGWRATWPPEVSQCGGPTTAPIMWTGHEVWMMRFTDHGRTMQANGRSLSYDSRCGYGEDSIAWSARWLRALTPGQFRALAHMTPRRRSPQPAAPGDGSGTNARA